MPHLRDGFRTLAPGGLDSALDRLIGVLAQFYTEKFGIKKFRVLTVTSSVARLKNLVQAAAAAEDLREDAGIFLFATEQDLPLSSPESVFTKIWTAPGKGEPCSIL